VRNEDIAANVRAEMAKRKPRLTATRLAEMLDQHDGGRALRRRLRGEATFSALDLAEIAHVLGVSVDHLTREDT
jgi:hypothetical protein